MFYKYMYIRMCSPIAQTSFCGSSLGRLKRTHFCVRDYERIGQSFLDSLLDFCDPDPSKARRSTRPTFHAPLPRTRFCRQGYGATTT